MDTGETTYQILKDLSAFSETYPPKYLKIEIKNVDTLGALVDTFFIKSHQDFLDLGLFSKSIFTSNRN